MQFGRRAILFAVLIGLLSACGGQDVIPTPLPIIPTIAPLTASAVYWDVGLSIKYPVNWIAPVYSAGEMMLVPGTADLSRVPPVNPVITIQAASPAQLNATKDTSLDQILTTVSGATADTVQLAHNATSFAGLDALFSIVQDKTRDVYEETVVFRLPDARIGWVIALAPGDLWGDYAPTLQNMLGSAALLTAADYHLPAANATPGNFLPGGLVFTLPNGWTGQVVSDAVVYHADPTYRDESGFSNGPQIVFRAVPFSANADAADILAQTLGVQKTAVQSVTVGKAPGIAGARYTETDPTTSQQVLFIAIPSADKTKLSILRWTTPAALIEVTRPLLDGILQSLAYAPANSPFGVK